MTKLTWPVLPASTAVGFVMGSGVGNGHAGDAAVALTKLSAKLGWKNPDGTPYVLAFCDYMYPGMDNSAWRLKCYQPPAGGIRARLPRWAGGRAAIPRTKVRVWSSALWPQGKTVSYTKADGSTGTRTATPADVLAGKIDANIRAFAKMCVDGGEGESILRLGWEADGGWFAWGVPKIGPTMFVAIWKHVVTVCRSVPGWDMTLEWNYSPHARVVYNGAVIPTMSAFPTGADANGKRWVDVCGIDMYDAGGWGKAWPSTDHAAVWTNELLPQLESAWAFSRQVGRPMAITEIGPQIRNRDVVGGVTMPSPGHGGADNPSFITNTAAWCKTHTQAYVTWFLGADMSGSTIVNTSRFFAYDENAKTWSVPSNYAKVGAAFPAAWAAVALPTSPAPVPVPVPPGPVPVPVPPVPDPVPVPPVPVPVPVPVPTPVTYTQADLDAAVAAAVAPKDARITALTSQIVNARAALADPPV